MAAECSVGRVPVTVLGLIRLVCTVMRFGMHYASYYTGVANTEPADRFLTFYCKRVQHHLGRVYNSVVRNAGVGIWQHSTSQFIYMRRIET